MSNIGPFVQCETRTGPPMPSAVSQTKEQIHIRRIRTYGPPCRLANHTVYLAPLVTWLVNYLRI
jgi:hypothetical protein